MGDFLPGVFRMIEERFGKLGRPFTTFLLGIFSLAIIAWCLGLIYTNVVGPVLSALDKEVSPQVVDQTIAWVTLAAFLGFISWLIAYVADRVQGRKHAERLDNKRSRIQALEQELAALKQDDDNGPIQ